MTDEPPESQPPWPDDQQQPYQRRHASAYEGFYAPRQEQSQPGYGQQPQHFHAPPRDNSGPGYAQPPYQSMASLFQSGSNDGDFRPSEAMTRWRPPKPRRRKILLVAAYAVAVVAVGSLTGVLVSSSATPAASKGSAAATVPPAARASSATSGVNGVRSWWATYGGPAYQQLVKTMTQLGIDATNAETTDNFSTVESDLTTALSEIQAAQADPPIPNATLERLWSKALTDYSSGVNDMVTGIQNDLDLSDIVQGAAAVDDGSAPMRTLLSDVHSIGS